MTETQSTRRHLAHGLMTRAFRFLHFRMRQEGRHVLQDLGLSGIGAVLHPEVDLSLQFGRQRHYPANRDVYPSTGAFSQAPAPTPPRANATHLNLTGKASVVSRSRWAPWTHTWTGCAPTRTSPDGCYAWSTRRSASTRRRSCSAAEACWGSSTPAAARTARLRRLRGGAHLPVGAVPRAAHPACLEGGPHPVRTADALGGTGPRGPRVCGGPQAAHRLRAARLPRRGRRALRTGADVDAAQGAGAADGGGADGDRSIPCRASRCRASSGSGGWLRGGVCAGEIDSHPTRAPY